MRIGIGEMWQESCVISPVNTKEDDFDVVGESELIQTFQDTVSELGGAISIAQADEVELTPLFSARASPSGPVDDQDFQTILSMFEKRLKGVNFDGIYLALHGGMMTDVNHDPEGTLIRQIRDAVGHTPIVASLDLHCNVTPQMVKYSDGLVAYRTSPHTDIFQTGERAMKLLIQVSNGTVRPRMALVRAPTLVTENQDDLFRLAERHEATQKNALAISFCPVQPFLDAPKMGHAGLAVTDNDQKLADDIAVELAREAWNGRLGAGWSDDIWVSIHEAIDEAVRNQGMTVMIDWGDNILAGAPGDSVAFVKALLDRNDTKSLSSVVQIVDPVAVKAIADQESGVGTATIGGSSSSRTPSVDVRGSSIDTFTEPFLSKSTGGYYSGIPINMGERVVYRAADRDLRVVITEKPGLVSDPSFLSANGIDPESLDIYVTKSGHVGPNFENIASAIISVDSPGILTWDFEEFPHEKARPIYPHDDPDPDFQVARGPKYRDE